MELSTAAVTGSARLVLQVVTGQRRPVIEFYFAVRHRVGPQEEFESRDSQGQNPTTHRYRPQDLSLHIYMVNIGGVRAENLRLELRGDLEYFSGYKRLSHMKIFNGEAIPQFAPAQLLTICNVDVDDLFARDEKGKVTGIRPETFEIVAHYDGPKVWLNRPGRSWAQIRRRKQYRSEFRFDAACLEGLDVPPAEYV
jgi:hypothetical protein